MVDWLFTLISWRILTGWLPVIDWQTSCQRPAALYRASKNRCFRFAHSSLFDPLVLYAQPPTEVLPSAAVLLVIVVHVARLCAAPLLRCGSSCAGPKFTAKSKVRWSFVNPFCTRHSRSAPKVSTLLFSNIVLQTLFLSNRSSPRRYYGNSPRIW